MASPATKGVRFVGRQLARHLVLTLAVAMPALAQSHSQLADPNFGGQDLVFVDSSAAAGLGNEIYASTDSHSLGVNWLDVDNDSWPDLFLVNGFDRRPRLYRNEGNGTFREANELLPELPNVAMSGSIFADYDNDGDVDIYIFTDNENWALQDVNAPDGPTNLLLRNQLDEYRGNPPMDRPLFEEVAEEVGVADLRDPRAKGRYRGHRSKAGAWFDYDRDGCVDLLVGRMVIGRSGEASNRDALFRNNCDGTFTDYTYDSGLNQDHSHETYRPLLASIAAHMDEDLWPDLYLVHATPLPPTWGHHDLLYRNNGDGTLAMTNFEDNGTGVGRDSPAGMGVDVADIDLDGDWDVYISDLHATVNEPINPGNALYLNESNFGLSSNVANEHGVSADNSWGVVFFDADHDGYEDLFVVTMATAIYGPFLYHNQGNGTFLDQGHNLPLGVVTDGRGAATADFDRDGDLDIALVNEGGTVRLLENRTEATGAWMSFKLEGTVSNRSAIGAVVTVEAGGISYLRQVKGGHGAHSQNSLRVHFGLGEALVAERVTIQWPSGLVTEWFDVATNAGYSVVETDSGL